MQVMSDWRTVKTIGTSDLKKKVLSTNTQLCILYEPQVTIHASQQ